MRTIVDFAALLKKYDLPVTLFKVHEEPNCCGTTYIVVEAPNGVRFSTDGNNIMTYDTFHGAQFREGFRVDFDVFFAPIIREEKLRKENEALKAYIMDLRKENAELRLLPDGPDYLAAKEHYENLVKK